MIEANGYTGQDLQRMRSELNGTSVTDLISEISVASNEQAEGISQITAALGQIDQVTQQNTAHAEETASAATELRSHAELLQNLRSRLQLRDSGDRPRRGEDPELPESASWMDREEGQAFCQEYLAEEEPVGSVR